MNGERLTLVAGATLVAGIIFWFLGEPGSGHQPAEPRGTTIEAAPSGGPEEAVSGTRALAGELRLAPGSTAPAPLAAAPEAHEPSKLGSWLRSFTGNPGQGSDRAPRDPDEEGSVISGRVVTSDGRPVPGMIVAARQFHADRGGGRLEPWGPDERTAVSAAGGAYILQGLALGEYELRTIETELYPSARTIVRAGEESAEIVLAASVPVRLHGKVTDQDGKALEGVRVIPAHLDHQTLTNEDGEYEADLYAQEHRTYALRFLADGYEEERIIMRGHEFAGDRQRRYDVQMKAEGEMTEVYGTLLSRYGDGVPNQRIALGSKALNARYSASSDSQGNFRFPGVRIGSQYKLTVLPDQEYRDYEKGPLQVRRSHPPIEIVLESLDTARLSGRMIDPEGRPIAGFRIWMRSTEARSRSVPVVGDDSGYFLVEDAPEGQLMLVTRSQPHFEVTGITLGKSGRRDVELVLDWGSHSLGGSVLEEGGRPIAGAQVSLSWSQRNGNTSSRSLRRGLTDDQGRFQFSQLGAGVHRLDVNAPGYAPRQISYDVGVEGSETELRMKVAAR